MWFVFLLNINKSFCLKKKCKMEANDYLKNSWIFNSMNYLNWVNALFKQFFSEFRNKSLNI